MKSIRVALCFLLNLLASCGKPTELPVAPLEPPAVVLPAHYEWLDAAQAEQLIADTPDLQIMDVRSDEEITDGHGWIVKSQRANYVTDNKRFLKAWDKTKPWLVYCAIGGRAELTAADMAQLGYQKVYLLKDGFNAWRRAGKPTIK